jgi:hypothetical protein
MIIDGGGERERMRTGRKMHDTIAMQKKWITLMTKSKVTIM